MSKKSWNTDEDRAWIDKLIEEAEKEADICLSCPLKKCRPYDCRRFVKEAKERGIYEDKGKQLRYMQPKGGKNLS